MQNYRDTLLKCSSRKKGAHFDMNTSIISFAEIICYEFLQQSLKYSQINTIAKVSNSQ